MASPRALPVVTLRDGNNYYHDERLKEYRHVKTAEPVAEWRVCSDCKSIAELCSVCNDLAHHWFLENDAEWGEGPPKLIRTHPGGEVYLCENHCRLLHDDFHDDGDLVVMYMPGEDGCRCDPWG